MICSQKSSISLKKSEGHGFISLFISNFPRVSSFIDSSLNTVVIKISSNPEVKENCLKQCWCYGYLLARNFVTESHNNHERFQDVH